ncbi:hypothetical protein AX17_001761 [Amanita inopinata Kibby_2008]|nr:hypothetical protein AX17_001761 [Amanita inopinata Kibby_2008]
MSSSGTTSAADQATIKITDAKEPFSSAAQADVILRSSDSVDFFVLRCFLRFVSPNFDDMFSLNRGEALEKNEMKNGMPIVPLEEDSEVLSNLLLLIYPYARQPAPDVDVFTQMAKAVQKYSMDEIEGKLRRLFLASQVMVKEPLRAFCIAIHFGWEEVAEAAAWNTLSMPLRSLEKCDELRLVNAGDYHDLLRWRFMCEDAVAKMFTRKSGDLQASLAKLKLSEFNVRQKVQATGCPRSTAGLKDSLIKTSSSGDSTLDVITACNQVLEAIEEAASKVPFDIACNSPSKESTS